MFLNKRSPLSVRVKSKTAQLFTMNKTDMVSISMNFPHIFEKISKRSAFNQKQLEILINKTKYLFYKNNKSQFINSNNDKVDNERYTHYYINSLDEEEMKKYLNRTLSLKSLPSSEILKNENLYLEDEKSRENTNKIIKVKSTQNFDKNSNPSGNNNLNSYKEFFERINNRMSKKGTKKNNSDELNNIGTGTVINNRPINESKSKSSSNSTISEKSHSDEEGSSDDNHKKKKSLGVNYNNNINNIICKATFGMSDRLSPKSEDTYQFKNNLNLIKFNENLTKNIKKNQKLTSETFKNYSSSQGNNVISVNKTLSHDILNNYNNQDSLNLTDSNFIRTNTIFSEFNRLNENNFEMGVNQEFSSDLSRGKDIIKNHEIKKLISCDISEISANYFNNSKNIQAPDIQKNVFVNDESNKYTVSQVSTDHTHKNIKNHDSVLCNININNNVNYNNNLYRQGMQSNCPKCNTAFFPITQNRTLLVFSSEKPSFMKESICWTNINVTQSESFELNSASKKPENLHQNKLFHKNFASSNNTNQTVLKRSNTINKYQSFTIPSKSRDEEVKLIQNSNTESSKSLKNKNETLINPNYVKQNAAVLSRRNSIDFLHQFKNTLFDQAKNIKEKTVEATTEISKIYTSLIDINSSPFKTNQNKFTNKNLPTNKMLSVVYKNIQENSMNLNEPKSFYSNMLMEAIDEKHKKIYMMKNMVDRVKDIGDRIISISKTKSGKFTVDKENT
jgi:hypothetical protein